METNNYKVHSVKPHEIVGESILVDLSLLDGGRTSFYCFNQDRSFWIRLVMHGIEEKPYEDGYWPGGLYLNGCLIDFNSKEEEQLLKILSNLKVPEEWYNVQLNLQDETGYTNEGASTEGLIKRCIEFIKSERYIELASRTGRK